MQVKKFWISIKEKKTTSTVAREMLELNVEETKSLKTLNLISGKDVVGCDAMTQGINSNQTNSQINTENLDRKQKNKLKILIVGYTIC